MSERGDLRTALVSGAGAWLLRLLAHTWRVRFLNPEVARRLNDAGQPFVYVTWHGQLLPLVWAHRGQQIAAMISEHRDGELIARVANAIGYRTVRGSTTRGGARALVAACEEIEAGHSVAVTVDGPRGPAGSVAPGAVVISGRTGAPMVPTTVAASRAWRLNSWDRFMIPKPFARVVIAYGEPLRPASGSSRVEAPELERVKDAINAATQVAESGT